MYSTRSIVDQWSWDSSKKTTIFVCTIAYQLHVSAVSSLAIIRLDTMSEELYTYLNTVISDFVRAVVEGGTKSRPPPSTTALTQSLMTVFK